MPAAVKHLIVTSARALPASTVSSCVSAYGLDPDAALVLTHCALAPDGTFAGALAAPQSVDTLVSLADDPDNWHAPEVLAAASRALRPGGSFVAATLVGVRAEHTAEHTARAAVVAKCLVAGLVPANAESETRPAGVAFAVAATKPATWEKGAAFSLKSRRLKENAEPRNIQSGDPASWKVLNTAEDDLLDEDELLDESELRAGADEAAAAKASGGCATSKSACKTCSCGRAGGSRRRGRRRPERGAEEGVQERVWELLPRGRVRCAGCPMLGQPPARPRARPRSPSTSAG